MNKRIFGILFCSFLVSGCFFGEVGSGYITKNCIKTTIYDKTEVIEERIIKSKDNEIVTITFNNEVNVEEINSTFKSIKNSYISEMNYLNSIGIMTSKEESENNIKVSYEFDINTINETIKEKYGFEELAHNQIKKYEKEGYECE